MASAGTSPLWVGEQFISKYYEVMEKLPKYLPLFYKEESSFSVTMVQPDGSSVVETASGTLELQAIQEKVLGIIANVVVASDKSLDAQFSQGNGVLLQVSGTMSLQGMERRFVQSFFLAPQEKGYYVLNDMLRIFPPEPLRDMRPLENGFVPVALAPTGFGLTPPQLPAQLPQRLDVGPSVAPSMPVPVPVPPAPIPVVAPPPAEAEPLQDKPATAPAPMPVPIPVPAPTVTTAAAAAVPTPAVLEAPSVSALQPAPAAPASTPTAPAPVPASGVPAPHQSAAQAAPAAPSPAPVPAQSLSWAERARLASSATPAQTSASKVSTPAKPAQTAPAAAPEAPASDVLGPLSAAPASSSAVYASADEQGEVVADSRVPEALEAVSSDVSNPGYGVYVQGIPQHLPVDELKKLIRDEFAQFGTFGLSGVNIVRSPRFGLVAYVFYQDEKSRDAARESNGKVRLLEGDKPVKILGVLPEFERGFAPRGGGRGERGRGGAMGGSYRGGRGGFDGGRGRSGRGEGGRGDRPLGRPEGRGGRGGGRSGASGRGPRDSSGGPAPKQA